MEILQATFQSLFSIRIVDDLDDSGSTEGVSTGETEFERKVDSKHRDRNNRGRERNRERVEEQHRRETKELRRQIERLEKQLASSKEDVDRHRKRRKDAEAERDRLAERNTELEESLDKLKEDFEAQAQEVERLTRDVGRHPMQDVDNAQEDPSRRLQEKDEEIRGLKMFLSKTDDISGTQVIDMVKDLNSEIERLAATVVDLVIFKRPSEPEEAWATEPSQEFLERGFGLQLCQSLVADHDHDSDPTLIQLAIQAWEVHCCTRVFDCFCLGTHQETDALLWDMFKQMQRIEPQAAAARWRSLTRAYTKTVQNEAGPSYDQALQRLINYNCEGLSFILRFAGCKSPYRPDATIIQDLFGSKVDWILHMACQLVTVTREEIMSTDFELIVVYPGVWFDADAMENFARERERDLDNRSDEKHGGDSEILCTVEFGLKCTTKAPKSIDNSDGPRSGLEQRILMKPRVVLPSIVDLMRSSDANSSV